MSIQLIIMIVVVKAESPLNNGSSVFGRLCDLNCRILFSVQGYQERVK